MSEVRISVIPDKYRDFGKIIDEEYEGEFVEGMTTLIACRF
jgi:hypothetical protein